VKTFQAPFVHGLSIAEKKRPPTVMVGGFLMGWNRMISCLIMSPGVRGSQTDPLGSSRSITDFKSGIDLSTNVH
jgi:hypothetical protein